MSNIFISYRRDDSRDAAQKIAARIAERFGHKVVFLDVDAIEAGADFSQTITDGIRAASIMFVIIGPDWLGACPRDKGPRIEDPDDFVRREIETALNWDVPIVPVLVGGASMPSAKVLPVSIRNLSMHQAHALHDSRWDQDCDTLARILTQAYDVDPLPEATTVSYLRERLRVFRRYPRRLARLVLRPKRFIATKALGRDHDSVDAFVFLSVSTALAVWLALLEWPGKSWLLYVSGVSVGALGTLLLSLPLYLAWRTAGASRDYGRVLTVLSYQCSVAHFGVGLIGLLFFGGINFFDKGDRILLERISHAVASGGLSGLRHDRLPDLFMTAGFQAVSPLLVASAAVIVAWLIASWGAYRRALGLSRLRSLIAFSAMVLFVGAPILLSVLATSAG